MSLYRGTIMKNKDDIDKRWEKFIEDVKKNGEASLGECHVSLIITEDGHPCVVLNDAYGSGFQLTLPQNLDDESKAALMLYNEGAKIDNGKCTPKSYEHVLSEEYRMFLLPEIDDELRETVKDIAPITVVKVIMIYADMIVDAALANDVNEIVLGPDGGIYVGDDVPYFPEDAEDQIMAATGLSPRMTEKMKQWVPRVSMQYNGLFPGMIASKDGFSSRIKIYDMDLASEFAESIDFLEGREISILTDEDMDKMTQMMEDLGINVKVDTDSGVIRITTKPRWDEIEEAIANTPGIEDRDPDDLDIARDIMGAAYAIPGTMATFDELTYGIPEERAEEIISIVREIIDSNRKNPSFMFTCGSRGITYLGNISED